MNTKASKVYMLFREKILENTKLKHIISNSDYRDFLTSINRVFFFKVIVYLITTIIIVLTARTLTPSQFGRTGVISNIAYLLFVPMILAVHSAMYKFLPESDAKDRKELMSIAALGSLISIPVFSISLLFINKLILKQFNIPFNEWQLAILLTIFLSLSTISESYLRGHRKFNSICLFKLFSAVINLVLIIICFFVLNIKSFEIYVYSLIISHLVFTALALTRAKIFKICKISLSGIKKVYIYSFSNILSMFLGGVTFSSDLFFVNYFCSSSTVGVYNAYQGFVKNIFSVLFYEVFLVVFLPFLAKANHRGLVKSIRRYIPVIIAAVMIGSGLLTIIFILLFGQDYKLNLIYIVLSSLGIALYTIYQIYVYVYNIEGSKRAMLTGLSTLAILPFALGLQYYLVRFYDMKGALISVVLTNLLLILSLKIANRGR
ncbi:O-antigen/teichoic acid export membrane protein [Ruminiclostridium sufflavum DSM 19573]|uniref:O-antigen/teichoic acid export membrane protein n=2 Tax=Ruminiclostridium TaxID=1508657 RepID=A0A318XKF9_9FIRM|nr:O-antigen/teichoic acid export membrane protein [Ruminiclostridium sufflavum DSM 19573]